MDDQDNAKMPVEDATEPDSEPKEDKQKSIYQEKRKENIASAIEILTRLSDKGTFSFIAIVDGVVHQISSGNTAEIIGVMESYKVNLIRRFTQS